MNSNEAYTVFIHENVNNTKTCKVFGGVNKIYQKDHMHFCKIFKILLRNVYLELSKIVFTILIIALCFSVDFEANKN